MRCARTLSSWVRRGRTAGLPCGVLVQCHLQQKSTVRTYSTTFTPADAGSGKKLGAVMQSKGFVHPTPNFSLGSDLPDTANLVSDLETTPAVSVDFFSDIYGPWLVMTDDLQGELFFDHDHFVYYRPANGLGYGIGKVQVQPAGSSGTIFHMDLETYSYEPTSVLAPLFGISFEVTGSVKAVHSRSANYRTMSLVGVWRKKDRNTEMERETSRSGPPSGALDSRPAHTNSNAKANHDLRESSGQFNAAKLSPWDPSSAAKPWSINEGLRHVFEEVFPQKLHLDSHLKRVATDSSDPTMRVALGATTGPKHLDLSRFAVGEIPGIHYIPDYISVAEEEQILCMVQNTPAELKSKLVKRTCQEWGCSMCEECKQSFVSDSNMPPWVQQCTNMLVYDGIFTPTTFPNSVRIHEYERGEGIGPHCDGPIYVPLVTILSLGSTSVMHFYPYRKPYTDRPMEHYNDTFKFSEGDIGRQTPLQTLVLEPRSLLVFSGPAYYFYPHGVPDSEVNSLSPEVAGPIVNRHLLREEDIQSVDRKYRVSITTRNLLTRCNHQTSRAEYNMKQAWYLYNQMPTPEPLFLPPPSLPGAPNSLPSCKKDVQVGSPPTSLSPNTDASLTAGGTFEWQRLEERLDAIANEQHELRREVKELTNVTARALSSESAFRKETSTVLNHLSTTVLDLDAKIDDITDLINDKLK